MDAADTRQILHAARRTMDEQLTSPSGKKFFTEFARALSKLQEIAKGSPSGEVRELAVNLERTYLKAFIRSLVDVSAWGNEPLDRGILVAWLTCFKPQFESVCHEEPALTAIWQKFISEPEMIKFSEGIQQKQNANKEEKV